MSVSRQRGAPVQRVSNGALLIPTRLTPSIEFITLQELSAMLATAALKLHT